MNVGQLEKDGAVISPCGRYRYALYRNLKTHPKWKDKPTGGTRYLGGSVHPYPIWYPRPCLFIMLNPSTADGKLDDPTIRRCLGFAHRLQCDELFVANLFAWRATDPRELRKNGVGDGDIIGPENMDWIKSLVEVAWRRDDNRGHVIAAWGPNGFYMQQDRTVMGWIDSEIARVGEHVECLGTSKGGFPRHPLMLEKGVELQPFRMKNTLGGTWGGVAWP